MKYYTKRDIIKYKLILMLLLVLSTSCGKKVTIKGKVYDAVTGEGISGVEITLGRANKSVILTGDGVGGEIIATTTTNQDGYYIFEERIRKNRQYSMAFHADSDKYILIQSNVFSINQEHKTIDFPLVPLGYLKQKVENESCFDENDILTIVKSHEINKNDYSNEIVWEGCEDWEYSGSVDGSPQGYVFAMMGWHYAKGFVIKNGVQTEFNDSIYIGAKEYVTWHIKY